MIHYMSEPQLPEKIGGCVKQHMSVVISRLSNSAVSLSTPPNVEHTLWEFFISCGRKFKTLVFRVGQTTFNSLFVNKLVTCRRLKVACSLVAVAATMRLVYRRIRDRRWRIEKRVSNVIKLSEEAMVLKTIAKVQYSTEYTNLTVVKIDKLFEQGCVKLRRDGQDGQPFREFNSSDWAGVIRTNDKTSGLLGTAETNNVVYPGVWHAVWNQPPPISVGNWDVHGKTQKISYDMIYLGRAMNRRKIQYICAADHGLSSGWIKFFYEKNDDIFNFLRDWRVIELPFGIKYDHLLMIPPGCWLPVRVPDPMKYLPYYIRQHRIKAIADKIAITMRSDGCWNENVFLATYRNIVSGNTQISIGHQLSDVTMYEYLPHVRQLVKSNRSFGGQE